MGASFNSLAKLCQVLEVTSKRNEKTRLIADYLKSLEVNEMAPVVLLLIGQVFPEFDSRTLEIGWSTMKRVLTSAKQTTLLKQELTIKRVYQTLNDIAQIQGNKARRQKERLLVALINDSTSTEVEVLLKIIFGEMRIGVNEGVLIEALSVASDIPLNLVRRALMLTGNIGEVALISLTQGEVGLKGITAEIFVPLKPMLAEIADSPEGILKEHDGKTVFEYKFDGARVQIHRLGDEVRIYSRRLTDVTESIPDIVNLVKENLPKSGIIVEGEITATGSTGKPLPFQDLMRRFTRTNQVEKIAEIIPLKLHLFDLLYYNGRLLIDESYETRWNLLKEIMPTHLLAERTITDNLNDVNKFLDAAINAGHEGLMAKRLDSMYSPGARGKDWLKLKPADTLDLVIIAADWGSGRRKGWLSNYHLAASDDDDFKIIGKTFKGLTDDEFRWMTKRLQSLKVSETSYTVTVKPEIVVEVAFNEIQKSSKYHSGFALRFARIKRIRLDKSPKDANTLNQVRDKFKKQFKMKDEI
ncbi:ATP-dependent DNA ligase [Candidatus Bathyarchaeota archaeon]|nr:ATP-dependent DNA ligase [Candidatus Bathyarchaeota archaeon]